MISIKYLISRKGLVGHTSTIDKFKECIPKQIWIVSIISSLASESLPSP